MILINDIIILYYDCVINKICNDYGNVSAKMKIKWLFIFSLIRYLFYLVFPQPYKINLHNIYFRFVSFHKTV